jgi:hypothetical protein
MLGRAHDLWNGAFGIRIVFSERTEFEDALCNQLRMVPIDDATRVPEDGHVAVGGQQFPDLGILEKQRGVNQGRVMTTPADVPQFCHRDECHVAALGSL